MGWQEVSIVSSRNEFVTLASQAGANIAGLCRRFGISRTTGYNEVDWSQNLSNLANGVRASNEARLTTNAPAMGGAVEEHSAKAALATMLGECTHE